MEIKDIVKTPEIKLKDGKISAFYHILKGSDRITNLRLKQRK